MKHTSTLGVRRQEMSRYTLRREMKTVHTPYGNVRVKYSHGMGAERIKPEYEDVAALAKEHGVPLDTIRNAVAEYCTDSRD